MKKTLYSTTALVAAGIIGLGASDAFAQATAPAAPEKMKLELGGFHNQLIGFTDHSSRLENALGQEFRTFDQKSDSEVYFTGTLKLDNGVSVGVMVQLETDEATGTGGTSVDGTGTAVPHVNYLDESYMRIFGGFGEFRLGSMDGASQGLSVSAPRVGLVNLSNSDVSLWLNKPTGNTASATCCDTTFGGGDQNRVWYTSPSFGGLRVAGSYTPSNTVSSAAPYNGGADDNGWTIDVAAQYAGSIDVVGFRAYVGAWENGGASRPASGATAAAAVRSSFQSRNYSMGVDATIADWTAGGGALVTNNRGNSSVDNTANSNDKLAYNLGVAYKPGPYALSLTWMHVEHSALSSDPDSDGVNRYAIGATYDLGPGVVASVQGIHQRYYDEADAANGEDKQYAIIGGIGISF